VMTKDKALDLALEALMPFSTPNWAGTGVDKANEAITAIKQVRSAPVQEPVAWRFQSAVGGWAYGKEPPIGSKYAVQPLYATPPNVATPLASQRQWVGLTDEEIEQVWKRVQANDFHDCVQPFARAIEAKLKAKNSL